MVNSPADLDQRTPPPSSRMTGRRPIHYASGCDTTVAIAAARSAGTLDRHQIRKNLTHTSPSRLDS